MQDKLSPADKPEIYRKLKGCFLAEGIEPPPEKMDCLAGILYESGNISDENVALTVNLMLYGKVCP